MIPPLSFRFKKMSALYFLPIWALYLVCAWATKCNWIVVFVPVNTIYHKIIGNTWKQGIQICGYGWAMVSYLFAFLGTFFTSLFMCMFFWYFFWYFFLVFFSEDGKIFPAMFWGTLKGSRWLNYLVKEACPKRAPGDAAIPLACFIIISSHNLYVCFHFLSFHTAVYTDIRMIPYIWVASSLENMESIYTAQKAQPDYKQFLDTGI